MRLIDADALGICKANRSVFDKPEYADGWNSAVAIVEDAPTVDAVEVVRCKDCKYYKKFKGFRGAWCHRWLRKDFEFMPKPNDFCSFGKRKVSE